MNKRKSIIIISIVLVCCLIMGIIDAVVKPQYMMKSIIKIFLFLICPIVYSIYDKELNIKLLFKANKQGLIVAFLSGISIFIFILGGYFLIGSFFNLSNITLSLTKNIGVNKIIFYGLQFIFLSLILYWKNSSFADFHFLHLKIILQENLLIFSVHQYLLFTI